MSTEERQEQLIEDLLTIHSKKALYKRLVGIWGFTSYPEAGEQSEALQLCFCELEGDYAKHSLKAITELNAHLKAGHDYYHAVERMEQLDSIVKPHHYERSYKLLDHKEVDNIANPIVQKALFEIRRVVNSLVKRYGPPAIIRIELAREMKASKNHRSDIESEQGKNRKRNEEIEQEILKHYYNKNPNITLRTVNSGLKRVDPKDRKKYRMWQDEQKELCPYCCEKIGINQLFATAEIEHILPYTHFSQSHQNTVVSCKQCNAEKSNRTPYETWGSDSQRWERITVFAKTHFTGKLKLIPKQRRLLSKDSSKESVEDFITRQLTDSAYIAKAAKKMLEKYSVPVDVNNGAATAKLRGQLGLTNLLPSPQNSGAYSLKDHIEQSEADKILQYNADRAKKDRRDHRHHAIDAFVVAITDRKMLKAMVDAHQIEQDRKAGRHNSKKSPAEYIFSHLLETWQSKNLRQMVEKKVQQSTVSNMIKRKVYGELHEQTLFGRSFYTANMAVDTRTKNLKDITRLANAAPYDAKGWIPDSALKNHLQEWAETSLGQKAGERQLPTWKDKPLAQFQYHIPCATTRKPLINICSILAKLKKDWSPGTGTWIAERSVHDALYYWLKANQLTQAADKRIEQILKTNPPQVLSKKNAVSQYIKSVTTAEVWSSALVPLNGGKAYAKKGSNHHVVLFHNGLTGKDKKHRSHDGEYDRGCTTCRTKTADCTQGSPYPLGRNLALSNSSMRPRPSPLGR